MRAREDHGAWVAIEQPYADPRLQPRDGPADTGRIISVSSPTLIPA
jgi:hypothetical protein